MACTVGVQVQWTSFHKRVLIDVAVFTNHSQSSSALDACAGCMRAPYAQAWYGLDARFLGLLGNAQLPG